MEEIDIKELIHIFWSKKLSIFIIVLIFIIIGSIYTLKFTTPLYSSTTTLLLVASSNDEQNTTITQTDLNVNTKLISTYSKLIKSKNVLEDVIKNLNLDIEEETLKEAIKVKSIQKTDIIEIAVENEEATKAALIANEIAKVFSEKVKELYKIENIRVINEADVEIEPSNINHKKDLLLFTLIGIVAAVMYILITNLFDKTVKTPEDIEKEFNLPVLASIPNYESDKSKGGIA